MAAAMISRGRGMPEANKPNPKLTVTCCTLPSELKALEELRDGLKAVDAKSFLDKLGLPGGTTAALGLGELSELLESPPPGVDEIAAIAKAGLGTCGAVSISCGSTSGFGDF